MSKDYPKNTVAIIDYGSGNLRSAAKAFEHSCREYGLDFDVLVTDSAADLDAASHIVLPGQGAFADCMSGLENSGMLEALRENVIVHGKPFLGICVGMQLLADKGLEHGEHDGLGWVGGVVEPLQLDDKALKIPHMGWNEVEILSDHPIFKDVENGAHYYFVHSFVFKCNEGKHLMSVADYGGQITAMVANANMIGVQFHPEKSQESGMLLLRNFLNWRP